MKRLVNILLGSLAVLLLLVLAVLFGIGITVPSVYYQGPFAFGVHTDSNVFQQPPWGLFSNMDVFDISPRLIGHHFYLLGSDGGGRDVLALVARGAPRSLEVAAVVVLGRFLVGGLAGLAMGLGVNWVRNLSRAMGRWVSGFPYLALAAIVIQGLTPGSRAAAFIVGMTLVGWRDIAEVVSERIDHVRSQPYAMGARSLGTGPLLFFRLHVLPHLRPALAIEIPFQAAAVLVLLAELGYLGVFLGGAAHYSTGDGGASYTLVNDPELGQLLAGARQYIELRQYPPVLVPAVALALAALSFELIGVVFRRQGGPPSD